MLGCSAKNSKAVEARTTSTVGKAIVKTNAIALKPGSPHSKDEGNVQGAPLSACSPEKGPSRSTSRRPTAIDYAEP